MKAPRLPRLPLVFAVGLFHLKVGARVALRALAPVVGAFLFIYYILRPEFSAFFFRVLLYENGLLVSGLTLALTALVAAKATSARVTLGAAGWFRHLPGTSGAHRRLAVIGAAVACAPVLLILAYLTGLAARNGVPPTLDPVSLRLIIVPRPHFWLSAALPFLGLAAALFWTPVKHPWSSRPLAFLALLLFGSGNAVMCGAGLAALAAADACAGPLRRGRKLWLFTPKGKSPGLFYLVALRAVGTKFVPAYFLSFIPLILSRLLILNNHLSGALASAAVRFGGALGITVFLAQVASVLAARRPPWPWVRSLPLPARERVATDAVFLGVPALSVVAVAFALDPWAGFPVLGLLPWLALRSASAVRRSPDLRTGPALSLFIQGGLAALLTALSPWTGLVALAAAPLALRLAEREERELKVSRWSELHHLAAGDSQSWSTS